MWDDLVESLKQLSSAGRFRELHAFRKDGVYLIDSDGNRLINFGSNDYLGLASVVASKVAKAPQVGATASGLVCGWTQSHQSLAVQLARFEDAESAVVFPSGFAACSGTIATLGRSGDLILSDQLNHASLIDGCRLARASCQVYPHRDLAAVRDLLSANRSQYRRVWIVTDSVFSMDGHLAPLEGLCDLADQFDATLVVDEAHATGVLGDRGSGACEALGLKERIQIRIGTLSKALGGQGGFVVCPKVVASFLINHCRPLIFSTALSLPAVDSARAALDALRQQPQRRIRVRALAQTLRQSLGLTSESFESEIPIVPIMIGADSDAVVASERLRRLGMFVPAIRPPTVPEGQARLRVSLSADHSDEMVRQLIECLQNL